ncbi:hypothetical protein MJC1_03585 [Methylocystis sp. MJC1]|uniref:DMT family transporter n=1 Tax=Methylocystis sp. MJC1 TaxID=2654282 RepID=UPI0013EC4007|nr:hypothetical protein MJC1_03585 [Methylocystis sp. MJC1]MBU6529298.1 DMT family transporter [Methylocystis sp. MJC1]
MVILLAPRIGISAVILFVVSAQVLAPGSIDHLDLFGAGASRLGAGRLIGIALVLAGVAFVQLAPHVVQEIQQ